ncbi:MAG: GNAT family N-acetyltransferase [Acidimicrobiales bacterium]
MNAAVGAVPVSTGDPSRLAELLRAAALGDFPPADGAVEVLPAPQGPVDAVVALTAHHVVAADVDPEWVAATLPSADLGAPMNATFLALLARRLGGAPGALDVVLAAMAVPGQAELDLVPVEDSFAHARLDRALRYRRDVRCLRDRRGGLLTIGHGLAGRVEVSIEVDTTARGVGLGSSLARAALGLAPPDVAVFAQVSPGNVASLRCFLNAGYRPIGAEVLFRR